MLIHGLFGNEWGSDIFNDHFIVVKSFNFEQQSADDASGAIAFFGNSIYFRQVFDSQFLIVDGIAVLVDFSGNIRWNLSFDVDAIWSQNDDRVERYDNLRFDGVFGLVVMFRWGWFWGEEGLEHVGEGY